MRIRLKVNGTISKGTCNRIMELGPSRARRVCSLNVERSNAAGMKGNDDMIGPLSLINISTQMGRDIAP